MSFLNPWAFGFGGIVPVIILLYLLKVKRRPLAVSTLMFWRRAQQENRRRALFHRLRQLFSLLLHLLIFALALLAMAHPGFDRGAREGSSTVIVLDCRARMQALEPDGQSRFAKAAAAAQRLISEAGPQRQIALLAAGGSASMSAPFTGDEKSLRERLAALAPTDAGGSLDEAMQLAHELLASRIGNRRVVAITDRPEPSQPGDSRGQPTAIEYISVATPRDNLAITQFSARSLPENPETAEVLLRVKNFGATTMHGNVQIALDGATIDLRPFSLAPGGTSEHVFPIAPEAHRNAAARGWLTAKLDTHDALGADDVAYAVLPQRPPLRVLLVTKENWFLEKLLGADPSLRFELLTPDVYTAELAEKFDVVAFDNFLPPQFKLDQAKGNLLFLGQTPFNQAQPAIEQPLFTDADASDPLLQSVNLEHVTLARAAALALPSETGGWKWRTPLRYLEHPLLIAGSRTVDGHAQRAVALGFQLTDSDLPLRVSFPLLMINSLRWLAQEQTIDRPPTAAGQIVPLESGERLVPIAERSDQTSVLAATPTVEDTFQPLRNGFYRIEHGDRKSWLGVNTADAAESDLRTGVGASSVASLKLPAFSGGAFGGWPLWQYFALAALALLTLEWRLFHRRRTE